MAGPEDETDEDWFERAVRESDASDGDDTDHEADPTRPSEADDTDTTDSDAPTTPSDPDTGSEDFGFDVGNGGVDESSGLDVAEAFDAGASTDETIDLDEGADAGGESFGFDLGQGPEEDTEFDEEFETDIPRIDLGIQGLDEMIQGGVPERSLIVAIGGAGTGKTTFGLQFLHEALSTGERGVFITLEESHDRVVQSAEEKGWEFGRHEEEGQLAVIDLDPIDMANSLTSIRNELPRLIETFGASRLVLDSVSLLEMMYDDQATRRTEIYDFTRALKRAGVTTMLTSEADPDNPFASRHGIIEYLTDAVFLLRHVRPEDFRETRMAIEIQKIRDANHSRETKPYEITNSGLSVYRQANIF